MDDEDYIRLGKQVLANPKKLTVQGNKLARELFEKAKALAHGHLAYLYVREYQEGWSTNPAASLKDAERVANESLAISDNWAGHYNLASAYWNQGDFEKSYAEYADARKLNPGNLDIDADEAEALIYAGECERAIEQIKQAIERHPQTPYWYWWVLARAYYMCKRYQDAIDTIGEIDDPPNDVRVITAASKAQLGDTAGAESEMAEFSKNDPEWSIDKAGERNFRVSGDLDHWIEGLRKAKLKENSGTP